MSTATDAMQQNSRTSGNHVVLRTGGILAMVGGIGYFIVLLFHGDLPDQSTAMALEHVSGRPEWGVLKLALIGFVLCWVGAFAMIKQTLPKGLSSVLGTLALGAIALGAPIVLIEYSILGYGFKNLADAWSPATGPQQDQLLLVGEALLAVTGGLFHNFVSLLIGLPFLLLGLAIATSNVFPRWMGWIAVLAATGSLISGVSRFLGYELVPYPILYGAFIVPLCLWLAWLGLLMMRRGNTTSAP